MEEIQGGQRRARSTLALGLSTYLVAGKALFDKANILQLIGLCSGFHVLLHPPCAAKTCKNLVDGWIPRLTAEHETHSGLRPAALGFPEMGNA